MAETIREDIIEVSVKVDDNALDEVCKTLDGLKDDMTEMGDIDPLKETKKSMSDNGIKETAGVMNDLKETIEEVSDIDPLKETKKSTKDSGISGVNDELEKTKKITDTLKNSSPFDKLKSSIKDVEVELKKIVSIKMTSLKSQFTDFISKLSAGEHGVRGFVNMLKSIGKIGFSKVAGEIGNIAKSASSVAVKGVTTAAGVAVKSVTAAAGAVAAGIGASFKFGTEFEDSTAKVSTVLDTSKKSIGDYKNEILGLSNDTGMAASELNEAAYQALSAGADSAGVVDIVNVAAKAAKGGFTDTATAVDGLTSTLNAFGMQTNEANGLANSFLITQNKGKTTFGELANSIGSVAPTASAAGVGVNELLASTAALTAQGIDTSSAMAGTKAALSNIIKPTAEASKMAQQLGLDFSASALKSKGLSGFLQEIKEKTGGNTEAMAQLFGSVEALNAVTVLTSDDGMKLMSETMEEMKTNTLALDNAYNTMANTVSNNIQKAGNSFKNLGISIFESNKGAMQQVSSMFAKTGEDCYTAFQNGGMDGLAQQVGTSLAEIVNAIVGYLPQIINAGVSIIQNLIIGIKKNKDTLINSAVEAISTFITGITEILPDLIGTVVELIVELFLSVNWLKLGWDIIKAIVKGIWAGIKGLGKGIYNGIKGMFTGSSYQVEIEGTKAGMNFAAGIDTGVETSNLSDTGLEASKMFANGLTNGSGEVTKAAEGLSKDAQDALNVSVTNTQVASDEVAQQISTEFTKVLEALNGLPTAIQDAITPITTVVDNIKEIPEEFASAFSGIPESIGNIKESAQGFNEAIRPVAKVLNDFRPSVELFRDAIKPTAENMQLLEISAGNVSGAMQNIGEAFKVIGDNSKSTSDGISNLSEKLPMLPPVFEEVSSGLNNFARDTTGVEQPMSLLVSHFDSLSTSLTNASEMLAGISTSFTDISNSLSGIAQNLSLFRDTMTGMPELIQPVTEKFTAFETAMMTADDDILQVVQPLENIRAKFEGLAVHLTTANEALDDMSKSFSSISESMTIIATQFDSINNTLSNLPATINNVENSADGLSNKFTEIRKSITTDVKAIETQISSITKDIVGKIQSGGSDALNKVKNTINSIKSVVSGAKPSLVSSGADMINGLISGIESKRSALLETVKSMVNSVNTEFDRLQDIHSPSKVWFKKGAYLGEGQVLGMKSTIPKIERTTASMSDASKPLAGYTPDNSSVSNNSSSNLQTNHISPNFTLNIHSNTNNRQLEYQIKRWIRQAMDDSADSLIRRRPRITEV